MSFKRLLFLLLSIMSVSGYGGGSFAIKTVVIDAGHGGKDPGAIGPGKTNEKDVALAVALKLGDYIQKNFPDVNVIYTRKTDVFIELHERADLANKNKADLFIAIHCNSNNSPAIYGTSTYVLGLHRTEANLEVAKRENSVILLEDDRDKNYEFDPNTPEGHIIMSMKQNAFLDQSIDIASKIEGEYESTAKRKSLGVKQAGFYVIYKTAMPSLLSEIGFISNPTEEKFLASDKGQDLIANSLFKAFKDYKFEMENSEGEQFAYEEAKRKAQIADSGANTHKDVPVTTTTNTPKPVTTQVKPVTTEVKPTTTEVKPVSKDTPSVTPTPVPSQPEPDNITATLLSGRKIRKPIDNASGGGIAPETENPVQPAPVKTIDNSTSATTNAPVKPAPAPVVKPAPKPVAVDTVAKKPVAETRKVTAGNSGGAAVEAEKPVTKPVVTEPKPDKVPVIKTEPKPTASVKPEPKTTETPVKKPDVKPTTTTSTADVMTFKVQLIALKGPMRPTEVTRVTKALGEITNETIPSGLIRYYSGDSKSYSEAKSKLAIAVSVGYKDAFVVGFKNGVRFGPEKLRQFENQ